MKKVPTFIIGLLFFSLYVLGQDLHISQLDIKEKDPILKKFIKYCKSQLNNGNMYEYHLYNFYGGEKIFIDITKDESTKSKKRKNKNLRSRTDVKILLSKLDQVISDKNMEDKFFNYLVKLSLYNSEYLNFIIRPPDNCPESYLKDKITQEESDKLSNYILQNYKRNDNFNDLDFFHVKDGKPQFPGGDAGILNFIKQNTLYPPIAKELGIEGRVYIKFVVDEKGKVIPIEIMKGIHPTLDIEAIRVINMMPEWIPGNHRGKPTPVYYALPFTFKLS